MRNTETSWDMQERKENYLNKKKFPTKTMFTFCDTDVYVNEIDTALKEDQWRALRWKE